MHLIVDSDPIVYRCGFAAESSEYHLVYEEADGHVGEIHFSPGGKETAGAKMKAWLVEHPAYTILEKEHVVIPGTEENALEAVRTQIYSIEKEVRDHYGVDEFSKISVILSGPGNYRDRLATIAPYKGNRDPSHKPYWYQSIRNYLTGTWGALVVAGREADDECSILARADAKNGTAFCVATIDKDLDQIPGNHYNYMKQVFYAQSESDAERFFWLQCLTGDITDGIPGCYRTGPAKAGFVLSNLARRDAWPIIVRAYRDSQQKKGCPYVDRDPAAVALEQAQLVKLQEYPGQLWMPPPGPDKILPEYRDDE